MKLRILKNSLRLRLSRTDLTVLSQQQTLEESLAFGDSPDAALHYRLLVDKDSKALEATFADGHITVHLPANYASEWQQADKIGFSDVMMTPDGVPLEILVEKDFTCLVPRGEEDADTFPHPDQ